MIKSFLKTLLLSTLTVLVAASYGGGNGDEMAGEDPNGTYWYDYGPYSIGPEQWKFGTTSLPGHLYVHVGASIRFSWIDTHNVYIHPSGTCDETGAVKVADETMMYGEYHFTTEDAGKTITFACDIGQHCEEGGMILKVTVMAPGGPTPLPEGDTILDIAVGDEDFSTLVAAVTAAGLEDILSGPGPLTVFAPTNDAFASLPEGAVEILLANPQLLSSVLLYHVVGGSITSDQITNGLTVPTVAGAPITFTIEDAAGSVSIGNAAVTTADIMASNGVIHVIDAVLLPPGFQLPGTPEPPIPTEPGK